MVKSNSADLEKIFDFLHSTANLKNTLRYSACPLVKKESVADHTWRLTLMTFLLADELKLKINKEKAMKISLVHDLGEAIYGDVDYRLIATHKVSKKVKEEKEKKGMQEILKTLPKKTANEIYSLWKEYQDQKTEEAKFVKAVDKLEALAYLIEQGHRSYDRPELIPLYGSKNIENYPALKKTYSLLKKRLKKEYKKGSIPWKEEYD